jgi:hypothetical protein
MIDDPVLKPDMSNREWAGYLVCADPELELVG